MTRERLSGAQDAEAGDASLHWLNPALIGNGSPPPTGGAPQDPEPAPAVGDFYLDRLSGQVYELSA